MKTTINNLNDVLAFQLEGMYGIIKSLQHAIPDALKHTSEPMTKSLLRSYAENIAEQRTKLKRIFGYVLTGPFGRKSGAMTDTIVPFKEISETNPGPLGDLLIIASMHATTQFMITSYTDARYIAMRVEMDRVVDILDEILDMEDSFLHSLRGYSAQLVNNSCLLAPVN